MKAGAVALAFLRCREKDSHIFVFNIYKVKGDGTVKNNAELYDVAPQYDNMWVEAIRMTKDTTLTIRLDKTVKAQAAKVAAGMGIDLATAINMFLVQIIKTDELPFVPTGQSELKKSMDDEKAERVSKTFDNADDLLDDALKDKTK
ncbi:hypothetical protein FD12_GL002437 [Lentilactobacillus rapi DSM 19907 = JCM 15042]|uniref:Uncharacterized protein n=1 Tax=Lentilactobacillus rapi DSM 19907 = JCM 15042 TaxID=1423795 RepID=A0ABR5PDV4_9LACO|nr:hypothetical protein FD12_GL002437 [Lentilactobacillus rapi DSM 19907 = JCM 15042]